MGDVYRVHLHCRMLDDAAVVEWHRVFDRRSGVRPLGGLTDAGVAMIAAMLLFIIPINVKQRQFTMNWQTAVKLPWGILLLFGGGLSLAAAVGGQRCGRVLGAQAGYFAGMRRLYWC